MVDLYMNGKFQKQFCCKNVKKIMAYIKRLENITNDTEIKASFNQYLHRIIIKVNNNEYGIVI